jgi:hypothetical protein
MSELQKQTQDVLADAADNGVIDTKEAVKITDVISCATPEDIQKFFDAPENKDENTQHIMCIEEALTNRWKINWNSAEIKAFLAQLNGAIGKKETTSPVLDATANNGADASKNATTTAPETAKNIIESKAKTEYWKNFDAQAATQPGYEKIQKLLEPNGQTLGSLMEQMSTSFSTNMSNALTTKLLSHTEMGKDGKLNAMGTDLQKSFLEAAQGKDNLRMNNMVLAASSTIFADLATSLNSGNAEKDINAKIQVAMLAKKDINILFKPGTSEAEKSIVTKLDFALNPIKEKMANIQSGMSAYLENGLNTKGVVADVRSKYSFDWLNQASIRQDVVSTLKNKAETLCTPFSTYENARTAITNWSDKSKTKEQWKPIEKATTPSDWVMTEQQKTDADAQAKLDEEKSKEWSIKDMVDSFAAIAKDMPTNKDDPNYKALENKAINQGVDKFIDNINSKFWSDIWGIILEWIRSLMNAFKDKDGKSNFLGKLLEGFLGKKFGLSADKIANVLNRPYFTAGMKNYEAAVTAETDLTKRLWIDDKFDVGKIQTTYFRNIAGQVITIKDNKATYWTVDKDSPKDATLKPMAENQIQGIEKKYGNGDDKLPEAKSKITNFIMKDINPDVLVTTLQSINEKAPYNNKLSNQQSSDLIKTTLTPSEESTDATKKWNALRDRIKTILTTNQYIYSTEDLISAIHTQMSEELTKVEPKTTETIPPTTASQKPETPSAATQDTKETSSKKSQLSELPDTPGVYEYTVKSGGSLDAIKKNIIKLLPKDKKVTADKITLDADNKAVADKKWKYAGWSVVRVKIT